MNDQCPECGNMEMYEAECDDPDCEDEGSLFWYCHECGWTDHPPKESNNI